jgi:hypothetical protein
MRTSQGVGERRELPVEEVMKPRGFIEERCEAQRRRSDDARFLPGEPTRASSKLASF